MSNMSSIESGSEKTNVTVFIKTPHQLQAQVLDWRKASHRVAFVPTMGNLHAGHLTLVKAAFEVADHVIVSIFVNPTQFGANEDFGTYPRTFDEDAEKLTQLGVDIIFSPELETLYPATDGTSSYIVVPEISDILEGEFRPGFFTGVATVVNKLFSIVAPDIAIFGEKDYQQLLVIKKMVHDMVIPVEIHSVATKREPNGLAMSSRNNYLQAKQREQASAFYGELQALKSAVKSGCAFEIAEKQAVEQLLNAGFEVDYITIRRTQDLKMATVEDKSLLVLGAVRLGTTRLIDNISFQMPLKKPN